MCYRAGAVQGLEGLDYNTHVGTLSKPTKDLTDLLRMRHIQNRTDLSSTPRLYDPKDETTAEALAEYISRRSLAGAQPAPSSHGAYFLQIANGYSPESRVGNRGRLDKHNEGD
jgi:hypothetical protein